MACDQEACIDALVWRKFKRDAPPNSARVQYKCMVELAPRGLRQRAPGVAILAGRCCSPRDLMAKARPPSPETFQDLIFALQKYWSEQGCIILQPYDMEMGAGTFHTATFLRAVGPEPWSAAYVQPSRRPMTFKNSTWARCAPWGSIC